MKVIERSLEGAGVCATKVKVEYDGNIIENIYFTKGCNGMAKAIAILSANHSISVISERLRGITCGKRKTSCADQLSKLLEEIR